MSTTGATMSQTWEAMEPRTRDAVIGSRLGFTPEIIWIVSSDGGKSCCASVTHDGPWYTKGQLEQWLQEEKEEYPEYYRSHEIASWERWPKFTTDAADDYRVLVRVRETWLFSRRMLFTRHLDELLRCRVGTAEAWPDRMVRYERGDYSHAAYLALTDGLDGEGT